MRSNKSILLTTTEKRGRALFGSRSENRDISQERSRSCIKLILRCTIVIIFYQHLQSNKNEERPKDKRERQMKYEKKNSKFNDLHFKVRDTKERMSMKKGKDLQKRVRRVYNHFSSFPLTLILLQYSRSLLLSFFPSGSKVVSPKLSTRF